MGGKSIKRIPKFGKTETIKEKEKEKEKEKK